MWSLAVSPMKALSTFIFSKVLSAICPTSEGVLALRIPPLSIMLNCGFVLDKSVVMSQLLVKLNRMENFTAEKKDTKSSYKMIPGQLP